MEWIGLKSASLPKPKTFDPASLRKGTNFIEPAYRHYAQQYKLVRELDPNNLESLAATQRTHVRPGLEDIWDQVLGGFAGKDVSSWLRYALCFDAVHKIEFPKNQSRDYWSDLIASGFFKADRHIRNLSKFRLAYRLWIRTCETLNRPAASPVILAAVREAHSLLKTAKWDDYLDGDLVHIAAYGVEDSAGARHRVISLTCDRPEVIILRIGIYKGMLSYVRKLYCRQADAEGFSLDYESSHNGEVHCFNPQGHLVRRINVANDAPALPFLGNEPS
jgi:hypothetical protein